MLSDLDSQAQPPSPAPKLSESSAPELATAAAAPEPDRLLAWPSTRPPSVRDRPGERPGVLDDPRRAPDRLDPLQGTLDGLDDPHGVLDGAQEAHDSSPAAHDSSPAAHDSSPAAHDSSPAAHDSSPAAHDSSPAAHDSSPAAHDSSPAAHDSSPAAHDGPDCSPPALDDSQGPLDDSRGASDRSPAALDGRHGPRPDPVPASLYRRHRPRTFDEVVGQQSVVRTLRNAVEQGKVHHAYLFVGSRGTGKTSMAKILAAALNCVRGPTTEPCGACESCRGIAAATSLDVVEMDAASNNSVDDIRELREHVGLAPISGRHKVYILDEAHMLSPAAWNAFLKTLEEPPPSTVFVLATTEAHKVPATVVDRCHRFDFHRPSAEQIAGVVGTVAASERIEIPPEAIAAIARSATGSFRDALGTLEQLRTYSGSRIDLSDVLAVLGVVDAEAMEKILGAVARGEPAAVLLALASFLGAGRDPSSLAADIEARARELLIVQVLDSVPAELSLTPEADERLLSQSQLLTHAAVVHLLELLAAARAAIRVGADARTQLELAVVKAADPQLDSSVGALLARMERLESTVGPQASPAPARHQDHGRGAGRDAASNPSARTDAGATESVPDRRDGVRAVAGRAIPADSHDSRGGQADDDDRLGTAEAVLPAAGAADPHRSATSDRAETVESLQRLWPAALDAIRAENALLGALMAEAQPVGLDGDELTLAFSSTVPFFKRKAEARAHQATVTAIFKRIAGRALRVAYELRDDVAHEPHGSSEDELIQALMSELDAEELPAGEPSGPVAGEPSGA